MKGLSYQEVEYRKNNGLVNTLDVLGKENTLYPIPSNGIIMIENIKVKTNADLLLISILLCSLKTMKSDMSHMQIIQIVCHRTYWRAMIIIIRINVSKPTCNNSLASNLWFVIPSLVLYKAVIDILQSAPIIGIIVIEYRPFKLNPIKRETQIRINNKQESDKCFKYGYSE